MVHIPIPSIKGVELGAWIGTDRDYRYEELLKRIYLSIEKDSRLKKRSTQKIHLEAPSLYRLGSKRVMWGNFSDTCSKIKRSVNHVLAFVLNELNTNGSLGADNKLILRGRWQQSNLELCLKKYLRVYVVCEQCRSPDTVLVKEDRIYFKSCQRCGCQT